MNDADLLAKLKALESESIGFGSGTLQTIRARALSRYLCEPQGDEIEGRSQVVSTDLRDTVEWVVPQWLRVCMAGDKIVEFQPIGPDDEKQAEVETEFINHVILERNDALTVMATWARDALISKNGYVKAYWLEKQDVRVESYKGQTDDALAVLTQDSEVEVVEQTDYQAQFGPMPVTLHDVRVRRTYPCGHVKIENVPPEELAVHVSCRNMDLQDACYVRHKTEKTLSEIRQMGFEVDDDIADDAEMDDEITEIRDRFDEDDGDSVKRVWLTEEWFRLDFDGDGIAELRRVVRIGSHILANEDCDLIPVACITPIVFPHRHVGLGFDDLLEQQHAVKTALMRQALDNLYLTNNSRMAANVDDVNIDDLLTSRPGGIVRVRGNPGDKLMPLVTPPTFTAALDGVQWVDTWKENSTGVSAYYQGMNADALNKTASGINQIMTASQQRIEAVIRTFANGFRDLAYIVHALTLKNATAAERVKLNQQWHTIDPREWVKRTNLRVTVGLGTGSKDIRVQQLGMVWQMQMAAMPTGIARPENMYETGKRLVNELGYRNADAFWSDPSKMPPQPPQPSPDQIKAQTAMQIKQMELQADAQRFQAETELRLREIQMQAEAKLREQQSSLTLQATNDERDAQREAINKQVEAQLQAAAQEQQRLLAEMKLAMDKYSADLDAQTKLQIESMRQESQQAEAVDMSPVMAKMDELAKWMTSPAEIVRGPDGRAIGIKKGGAVRAIQRGPDGRPVGVQ
jgi:hypothetical protein